VLPILHLNGYKIANPTILARISRDDLERLFFGYGYKPHFVEGDDPAAMHKLMAATLDTVLDEIAAIQRMARGGALVPCPRWPMIILRSPKGWTGPKIVDGHKVEGTWRSHQVPFGEMDKPEHVRLLARNSHSGVDFSCGGEERRGEYVKKRWLWVEAIGCNFCGSCKGHCSRLVSRGYVGGAVWFVRPSPRR
jgi:hypothetical protein